MKGKTLLVSFVILICFLTAIFIANYTYNTDFPSFYRAANIVLDPDTPITAVYETSDSGNKYNIPEAFVHFRFSILIAYMFAPLALLPYVTAKAFLVFIETIAYAASGLVVLRLGGASGRWLFYPFVLSLLWMPFIHDIRFVQVNAILLFLIALAVWLAVKNRPVAAGILMGATALFKVFPIAIAMVLGLKNWRILAACIMTFALALVLPGSQEWFASFTDTPFLDEFYSVIYNWLKEYGILLYAAYATIVGGITALVAYSYKDTDYPLLASLAIPAVFLTMPVIEYFHLVLLIFPYSYLLALRLPGCYAFMVALSFAVIYTGGFFFPGHIITGYLIWAGLFILWITLLFYIIKNYQNMCRNNDTKPII